MKELISLSLKRCLLIVFFCSISLLTYSQGGVIVVGNWPNNIDVGGNSNTDNFLNIASKTTYCVSVGGYVPFMYYYIADGAECAGFHYYDYYQAQLSYDQNTWYDLPDQDEMLGSI